MDWHTKGHQNQKIFLENALKNKNFSHAYLFSGPSQIGKRTLALEFAGKILANSESQGSKNSAAMNPDLIVYESTQNKIEDIRNLIRDLALKPYASSYKVAIIDDFENVTEEAANSILKTLEEPSPTTIIILIAANKKKLLPTIISRCQNLYFNRLPDAQLEAAKDKQLAELFNGKIGKQIRFAADTDFKEELLSQTTRLAEIKKERAAGRLLAVKDYAEMESAELSRIFENWIDQEHYQFVRNAPQNFKNLALLSDSLSGLRQNFNKKLILEKLFLNLA